jgi:Fe-S cluster assembly protein SufD
MADDTVKRVVRKITRTDARPREFIFTQKMLPAWISQTDGFVQEYRQAAWRAFEQLAFPTTSDEAWRRTDLKHLALESFRLPDEEFDTAFPEVPSSLLAPLTDRAHGGQIIQTPFQTRIDVDPEITSRGVIFTDLETAERKHPEILKKILGGVVRANEGKFSALAGALARYGTLVYVPKNVQLEEPLHSVIWGPGSGCAYFSHVLVWLEDGASLTYVHEASSPTEHSGQTLHAGIVEIHVGDHANLRFVELQSWGEHVWNFTHERARAGRDANLDWIVGTLGSNLTKTFADLDLVDTGASGRMSGFYFTEGVQHLDFDTQQNHMAPHTTSDLLFKGALTGESRSVWQGMIYVAPGAQKTDGYQANRNLVLSRKARADSIPGLEILADDVRCTHGATVGKVDPEQIFYLRARGIPERDAERLLVEGFFDPVMKRIPFEGVQERFAQAIMDKMSQS